jgi:hypothetical protein
MFYVSQKVVCIDADGLYDEVWGEDPLREGQIYTVRWVGMTSDRICAAPPQWEKTLDLRLAEIDRSTPGWEGDDEVGYEARRFRPLVKTDISVFTAMLEPLRGSTVDA